MGAGVDDWRLTPGEVVGVLLVEAMDVRIRRPVVQRPRSSSRMKLGEGHRTELAHAHLGDRAFLEPFRIVV